VTSARKDVRNTTENDRSRARAFNIPTAEVWSSTGQPDYHANHVGVAKADVRLNRQRSNSVIDRDWQRLAAASELALKWDSSGVCSLACTPSLRRALQRACRLSSTPADDSGGGYSLQTNHLPDFSKCPAAWFAALHRVLAVNFGACGRRIGIADLRRRDTEYRRPTQGKYPCQT
jgi:hypothetical protein